MFLRFLDTLFVRYGNTSGRADRAEFWCFHFFNLILIGGLCVLTLFLAGTLGDSLWAESAGEKAALRSINKCFDIILSVFSSFSMQS